MTAVVRTRLAWLVLTGWLSSWSAAASDQVSLQLRWDHQFEFAGYYAALWQGYYAEAGLDVEIRSAFRDDGTIVDAVQAVEAGRADFGIGAADILIESAINDPLTVLASVFQTSGTSLYARGETTLETPADLLPLRLARRPGDLIDVEIQAMLRAEGIDLERLATVPLTPGSLDDLAAGRVDVVPGYRFAFPLRALEMGLPLHELRPASYGIDFYGDTLFAKHGLVAERPDLARAFMEASLRGWRYAFAHQPEVAARIVRDLPRLVPVSAPLSFNLLQAEEIRRLVRPDEVAIGHTNPVRWERMAAGLMEQGLLDRLPDFETFIFDPGRLAAQRRRDLERQLGIGLLVGGLTLVGGLIWLWQLRHQVRVATARLRDGEARMRGFAEIASDWFWEQDARLRFTRMSSRFEQVTGISPASVLGRRRDELISQDEIGDGLAAHLDDLAAHRPFRDFIWPNRTPDGRPRWLSASGMPVFDAAGAFRGYRGTGRDVTRRVEAERALGQAHAIITGLLDNMPLGVIEWVPADDGAASGRIRRWTGQAQTIFGWDAAAAINRSLEELTLVDEADLALAAGVWQDLVSGTRERAEVSLRCRTREGRLRHCRWYSSVIREDRTGCAVLTLIDDTTEQVEAEKQIRRLASHDTLTGLPNRLLFNDRMRRALALADRHTRRLALLFVDLDRFKEVNDTLGHPAGDLLIRAMAERLLGCVRGSDTVARLGGDEFAILLPEIAQPEDACGVAGKVLATVRQPVLLEGAQVTISGSVGVAVFPDVAQGPDELLKQADIALYRAKALGRDRICLFSQSMENEIRAKRSLEAGLRHALERGELILHYQAQFDLRTSGLVGAEALVRWRQPSGRLVEPGAFVPVAESSGLILPLGEWVMDEACRQVRAWRDIGLRLPVSVNLSAHQTRRAGLADLVRQLLARHGIEPGLLELEITETVLFDRTSEECLMEVMQLGVGFAIDDFGTGYSSLGYLDCLPFQRLKIDRVFIEALGRGGNAEVVVKAVVDLAHRLGRQVVAEGVETEAQRAFLLEAGCDQAQGFLLGRAMPAGDLLALARTSPCASATFRSDRLDQDLPPVPEPAGTI